MCVCKRVVIIIGLTMRETIHRASFEGGSGRGWLKLKRVLKVLRNTLVDCDILDPEDGIVPVMLQPAVPTFPELHNIALLTVIDLSDISTIPTPPSTHSHAIQPTQKS